MAKVQAFSLHCFLDIAACIFWTF